MKGVKEEIQNKLNEPLHGHSSREAEQRCKRLEEIVLMLADKIDKTYPEQVIERFIQFVSVNGGKADYVQAKFWGYEFLANQ